MLCKQIVFYLPICLTDHLGPTPESQVAVVGAGIAGLAAAASLCEAGYKVVLLEAANYVGRHHIKTTYSHS